MFYNNSAWDTAPLTDNDAIATDKQALLPGVKAGFVNYTSYSSGINGIMVDLNNVPGTITASDFGFKVGNDSTPSGWASAPAPISVTPGAGPGGTTRVTIIWDDGVIQKQWLQVTVKATANTGLAADDVFYFGNAVGECGDGATYTPPDAKVNATDEIAARNNPHTGANPAAITDATDFNRDKKVDATDQIIARNNGTTGMTALQLITPP